MKFGGYERQKGLKLTLNLTAWLMIRVDSVIPSTQCEGVALTKKFINYDNQE
jgi:hypothetical protein